MNKFAKHTVTVAGICARVENVLVPELIDGTVWDNGHVGVIEAQVQKALAEGQALAGVSL